MTAEDPLKPVSKPATPYQATASKTMNRKTRLSKQLREKVLARDGHRCVLCWRKWQLTVHHFPDILCAILPPSPPYKFQDPYLSQRLFELITLCVFCHGKIATCDKGSPLYQLLVSIIKRNYEQEILEVAGS